jgi:hypothetical protein
MAIEKKNTDEARKWLNFFFNGNKEAVENYLSRF